MRNKAIKFESILSRISKKYKHGINSTDISWLCTKNKIAVLLNSDSLLDIQCLSRRGKRVKMLGKGANAMAKDQMVKVALINLKLSVNKAKVKCAMIYTVCNQNNKRLAIIAERNCITGFELYKLIPGTLGGSVTMNSGINHLETKNLILRSIALSPKCGTIKSVLRKKSGFNYRKGKLSKRNFILLVKSKGKALTSIRGRRLNTIKLKKQPIRENSCGSAFTNTCKYKAWKLLDASCLRGIINNQAQVSSMHCNFLITKKRAFHRRVFSTFLLAKNTVKKKLYFKLSCEIKFV